jgi:hypothetical protein
MSGEATYGRAKPFAGGLHLAILAAFVFLTISP